MLISAKEKIEQAGGRECGGWRMVQIAVLHRVTEEGLTAKEMLSKDVQG